MKSMQYIKWKPLKISLYFTENHVMSLRIMSCLINSEWTESEFTLLVSIIKKLLQGCECFHDYNFYSYWHVGKRCVVWCDIYYIHIHNERERIVLKKIRVFLRFKLDDWPVDRRCELIYVSLYFLICWSNWSLK